MDDDRKAGKLAKGAREKGVGRGGCKTRVFRKPALVDQGIDKNLAGRARKALAAATRIGEVKDIYDKAAALKVYAFQARDGELASWAVEIRERAVLRLGELTDEQPKAKGTRGTGRPKIGGVKKTPPKKEKTLAEQGIDNNLAKRARTAVADKKAGTFEARLKEKQELAVAAAGLEIEISLHAE